MIKVPLPLLTILSGRVLLIAYSVVSLRLATELLGPREMGAMSVLLSAVAMFAVIIGSISLFFNRQVVEWHLEGRLFNNVLRYSVFLAASSGVSCLLMWLAYGILDGEWTRVRLHWLLAILAGNLFLTSLNGALVSGLNSLGYRLQYVLLSNLANWFGLGFATIGCMLLQARAEYWMSGILVGQTISLGLSLFALGNISPNLGAFSPTKKKVSNFSFLAVLRFSWPLTICTGLYWVQRESFRPLMTFFFDIETIGLFSVGYSVGMMVLAPFDTLFREYYGPIYSRAIAHASYEQKIHAWNSYAAAYFPAVVLLFLFVGTGGQFFLRLLASDAFQRGESVVIWGALSQAAVMFYATYVQLTSGLMDNRVLIVPNVFGTLLLVPVLLLSIELHSVLGIAMALTCALAVTAVATAWRISRQHPLQIPLGRMLLALLWGGPLVIGLIWANFRWPSPSQHQAFVVLIAGGLYLILAQYRLAKPWLHSSSFAGYSKGLADDR